MVVRKEERAKIKVCKVSDKFNLHITPLSNFTQYRREETICRVTMIRLQLYKVSEISYKSSFSILLNLLQFLIQDSNFTVS